MVALGVHSYIHIKPRKPNTQRVVLAFSFRLCSDVCMREFATGGGMKSMLFALNGISSQTSMELRRSRVWNHPEGMLLREFATKGGKISRLAIGSQAAAALRSECAPILLAQVGCVIPVRATTTKKHHP